MPKILVVDDEKDIAENLAAVLEKEGFDATTAYLSEDVVDTMVENPPDIAVLDVMAPENPSAGFIIARKIRATEAIAKLPIIMLTGVNQAFPADFSEKDIDDNWMPIQAFMEKPADPVKLIAKIQEILND